MAADKMADAAAQRHTYPTYMHSEANIRKDVTMTVQRHLVRSWLLWCDLHREARDSTSNENGPRLTADQHDFVDVSREAQGQFVDDWVDPSFESEDPFAHIGFAD